MAVKHGLGETLQVLRQVVSDRGHDYVYKEQERQKGVSVRCKYVENDGPSCIVGHVASRLGVPIETLKEWDEGFLQQVPTVGYRVFDESALDVLSQAQFSQDYGSTWGEALRRAEERAAELSQH